MSENQQDRYWRRSSRCESGHCVEVFFDGELVLVRNSREPNGPWLTFDADEWRAFTAGLVAGELRG